MKIKNPNAGVLTNFEVLDFLRSRGASKDVSRVIAPVAPSEYKVYDYLVETPACNQTREQINEFVEKCKTYDLAKAEILNIINIRPSELVEIDPILEESDKRFGEEISNELLELVKQVLPPPPAELNPKAGIDEDREETGNEKEVADGENFETS